MPGHEHDAVVDHLVGDRDRLLGIAGVVADLEDQLLAEHAAGGIEVLHRLLGALLHLLAEDGVLAGHRTGGGDHDIGLRRAGAQRDGRAGGQQGLRKSRHFALTPWFNASL